MSLNTMMSSPRISLIEVVLMEFITSKLLNKQHKFSSSLSQSDFNNVSSLETLKYCLLQLQSSCIVQK